MSPNHFFWYRKQHTRSWFVAQTFFVIPPRIWYPRRVLPSPQGLRYKINARGWTLSVPEAKVLTVFLEVRSSVSALCAYRPIERYRRHNVSVHLWRYVYPCLPSNISSTLPSIRRISYRENSTCSYHECCCATSSRTRGCIWKGMHLSWPIGS